MRRMIEISEADFVALTIANWGIVDIRKIYNDVKGFEKEIRENPILKVKQESFLKIAEGLAEIGQQLKDASNEIINKNKRARADDKLNAILEAIK